MQFNKYTLKNGDLFLEFPEKKLEELYIYYYTKEGLIDDAKKNLNLLIFHGGIELISGINKKPWFETTESEKNKLIDLFANGQDWKRMFGFCAIEFFENKKSSKLEFRIAKLGSGGFGFYLKKGWKTISEAEFIFVPYVREFHDSDSPSHIRKDSDFTLSKDYFVYTWSGLEPDIKSDLSGVILKSIVPKLYAEYINIIQYDKTHSSATMINSFPMAIVGKKTEKKNIEDQVEEELHAMDIALQKKNARPYQDDRIRQEALEIQGELTKKRMIEIYDALNGKMIAESGKNIFEKGNVVVLHEGEYMEKQLKADYCPNYVFLKNNYHNLVLRSMGFSTSDPSQQTKVKVVAEQNRESMESAIKEERRSIDIFFKHCYNFLNRYKDTELISEWIKDTKESILVLQKEIEYSTDENKNISHQELEENQKRLQVLEKLKKDKADFKILLHTDFRISVKFGVNPFDASSTKEDIDYGYQNKFITELETINIYRSKMSLSPLSENDPHFVYIKKIQKLKQKLEEETLKSEIIMAQQMAINGNENGGGGEGGISKDKMKSSGKEKEKKMNDETKNKEEKSKKEKDSPSSSKDENKKKEKDKKRKESDKKTTVSSTDNDSKNKKQKTK